MAKRNKTAAEYSKAFMVLEATSFHGGFGAYMNMIMSRMELEMQEAGYLEPYKWSFGGGDGYSVPIIIRCAIT